MFDFSISENTKLILICYDFHLPQLTYFMVIYAYNINHKFKNKWCDSYV